MIDLLPSFEKAPVQENQVREHHENEPSKCQDMGLSNLVDLVARYKSVDKDVLENLVEMQKLSDLHVPTVMAISCIKRQQTAYGPQYVATFTRFEEKPNKLAANTFCLHIYLLELHHSKLQAF